MNEILKNCAIDRVEPGAVAGTTDLTSDSVDMAGFEGVIFIASFGALTSSQVTKIKAQQSDDDGSADDFTDIEGSVVGPMADADSDKNLVCEIKKPTKRYVRCIVDRGTANAVLDGVTAIRYGARKAPVTQGASVSAGEVSASPAEGTA